MVLIAYNQKMVRSDFYCFALANTSPLCGRNNHNLQICCERLTSADVDRSTAMTSECTISIDHIQGDRYLGVHLKSFLYSKTVVDAKFGVSVFLNIINENLNSHCDRFFIIIYKHHSLISFALFFYFFPCVGTWGASVRKVGHCGSKSDSEQPSPLWAEF